MTAHATNLLFRETFTEPRAGKSLSAEECKQIASDIRTGLRAIGIYTDLMQRDLDAAPIETRMQQYCDGINATIRDLTIRLEQLSGN